MRLRKRVPVFLFALGFFAGSLFAQQKFTTQLIPRKVPLRARHRLPGKLNG
jgi:hypothetical protein